MAGTGTQVTLDDHLGRPPSEEWVNPHGVVLEHHHSIVNGQTFPLNLN